VTTTILVRRGTAAEWGEADAVLQAGEPGYDTTAARFKIGDGKTAWSGLPWLVDAAALAAAVDSHVPSSVLFLLKSLGGFTAWDDFNRPDLPTLQGAKAPSGQTYRVSGDNNLNPVKDRAYAPKPSPQVAQILFVDHPTDYTCIGERWVWVPGTTGDQNVVLGSCAQYFGTNGSGGSLQLAAYANPSSGMDWILFSVPDPVVHPYTTIANGTFRAGFTFKIDGKTEYTMSMRRTGDQAVTIKLPDGQLLSYTHPAVKTWGRALGIQLRRSAETDGYARFTGFFSAETPSVIA